MAVLGLCCCLGFSLVAGNRGYSLVVVQGLPIVVASHVEEHGLQGSLASVVEASELSSYAPELQSIGSIVVANGLSCSTCGIFPDQGSTLCLLRGPVDPLLLRHWGSPSCTLVVHFSNSYGKHLLMCLLLLLLLCRFSLVRLCATPQTAAHQAPPSLGFSRQEYWSGLPFPSPVHESESEVAQSCLTLHDLMDCSPPRLLCPWDFPGKSTGAGCHCLLRLMCLLAVYVIFGFPRQLSGKESTFLAGDRSLILRLERFLGKGNGNPLQYSCLRGEPGRL